MAVSDHLRRTVALITAPGPSPGESTRPLGSGFFVSVLESHFESPFLTRRHEYLVTAGHLVRGEERTFVRLRRQGRGPSDGGQGVEEIGIGRWYWPEDPAQDVAAAPLGFSVGDFDHVSIHLDPYRSEPGGAMGQASGGGSASIGLGDPIHIISLLSGAPWAGARGIPVVRSGTVAAAWQSAPLAGSARDGHLVSGHLVDAAGASGPGGSPCFRFDESPREELPYLIQEARKLGDETLWQKALERHQETKFFGMMAGAVAGAGSAEGTPDAAGIAIVAPRDHVIGLIHSEPLRRLRAEHMQREVEVARDQDASDRPPTVPDTTRSRGRSRRWR